MKPRRRAGRTGLHFLERYHAGEREQVWRELIELGDKVLAEPLRSEATLVCEEVTRRARENLRTIHARLLDMGYDFAEPRAALVDAAPDAETQIEELERELGAFPLIARVWYRTLASVNFSQAEGQRVYSEGIQAPAGPDIFGLGSHPVLIVQSLERCREEVHKGAAELEDYIRQMKEGGWEEPVDLSEPNKLLPLGGWASNCDPKGFTLPCSGIDAVIYDDGGGEIYFVDELRSAFRWGGFPFWKRSLKDPDFYAPFQYRPSFEKLLPILKEGLLEL